MPRFRFTIEYDGRPFVGWQRQQQGRSVQGDIEAAILATRFHLLPAAEIDTEFRKLRVIVEKTGDVAEHEAMAVLEAKWGEYRRGGTR